MGSDGDPLLSLAGNLTACALSVSVSTHMLLFLRNGSPQSVSPAFCEPTFGVALTECARCDSRSLPRVGLGGEVTHFCPMRP